MTSSSSQLRRSASSWLLLLALLSFLPRVTRAQNPEWHPSPGDEQWLDTADAPSPDQPSTEPPDEPAPGLSDGPSAGPQDQTADDAPGLSDEAAPATPDETAPERTGQAAAQVRHEAARDDGEAETSTRLLEILPDSAYPEPRVRGIKGGSLWMTFHGLQWPDYRRPGIGVSGYVWIDTGYERIDRGNPSEQGIKYVLQQGRLLLRATPTYASDRWFIQGQAELVANKDQSSRQPDIMDADDVWIRAGMWDAFDVQLGRFEAWEVYHFGMGLDLNTLERRGAFDDVFGVPDIYGVTYAFYRPPSVGQAAVHVYPTDFLRFEVGAQVGNEFGSNALAARPVGVLDFGWVKLKLGAEYKALTDQRDGAQGKANQRGAGAALQFIADPWMECGVNGAYGLVDRWASDGSVDEKGSIDIYSLGGFANLRVVGDFLLGGGANLTRQQDIHFDQSIGEYGRFGHFQTFVALQYIFIEHLYTKVVLAYAFGDFDPNFGEPIFDNTMLSGRLRLMYMF